MLSSKLRVTLGQEHRAVDRGLFPRDLGHFPAGRAWASVSSSVKQGNARAPRPLGWWRGRNEMCAWLSTAQTPRASCCSVHGPVNQLSTHIQRLPREEGTVGLVPGAGVGVGRTDGLWLMIRRNIPPLGFIPQWRGPSGEAVSPGSEAGMGGPLQEAWWPGVTACSLHFVKITSPGTIYLQTRPIQSTRSRSCPVVSNEGEFCPSRNTGQCLEMLLEVRTEGWGAPGPDWVGLGRLLEAPVPGKAPSESDLAPNPRR